MAKNWTHKEGTGRAKTMSAKRWTLHSIPWDEFDPSKVPQEALKVVKAAALVEFNGGDYATYLCNVFPDDPEFQAAAKAWGKEEVQHGQALARWAELADPTFNFDECFQRFTAGYQIPLEVGDSIRGSRTGELVARCIVEVGTSSHYAALAEATDEPVLKAICRAIAADELRHYKLFYSHLKRYLKAERISRLRRFWIAMSRINETEDDELAYAYYAANGKKLDYEHKRWSDAYLLRAYSFYKPRHVERAIAMTFKAAGLKPQSRFQRLVASLLYRLLQRRRRHMLAAGAAAY